MVKLVLTCTANPFTIIPGIKKPQKTSAVQFLWNGIPPATKRGTDSPAMAPQTESVRKCRYGRSLRSSAADFLGAALGGRFSSLCAKGADGAGAAAHEHRPAHGRSPAGRPPAQLVRACSPRRTPWSVPAAELRRTYINFPWAHIYEHPISVASVAVERRLQDEDAVLFAQIRGPEDHMPEQIDSYLRDARSCRSSASAPFAGPLRISRLPLPSAPAHVVAGPELVRLSPGPQRRHLRRQRLFGARGRVAAPADADDHHAELRRHRRGRQRGRSHHLRSPRSRWGDDRAVLGELEGVLNHQVLPMKAAMPQLTAPSPGVRYSEPRG